MTDHHLDPPEEYEAPECCGEEMTVSEDGDCECKTCGNLIEAHPDIEPIDEWKCGLCGIKHPCGCDEPYEGPEECPHGNTWGECGSCDYLGDIAYDSARERR